jgi:hypothetical protein
VNSRRAICDFGRSTPMKSPSTTGIPQLVLRFGFKARALSAVLGLSALALLFSPNRVAAGPFATTTLSPNSQTNNVGTPSSIDVIFSVGSALYGQTYGLEAWLAFDQSILQVTSLTNGPSSPFTSVATSTFNNTLGTLQFKATGSLVSNTSFTAFTINFTPVLAGTSPITFQNVNQYFNGFGPFGVNGGTTGGSVTVVGSSTASVPDASSSLMMLSGGLLALAALHRRFSLA